MKKSLSLIACIVVGFSAQAKGGKMNAETAAETKTLVENCVTNQSANAALDHKIVLEALVDDMCLAIKQGLKPGSQGLLNMAADSSELQFLAGECIVSTVEGKFVNAPRETEKVDIEAAMNQLQDAAGAKMGGDNTPCGETMCGLSAEAQAVKKSCQNFVQWDSLRRAADTIRTSEYRGYSKDIAHDKTLEGFKVLLEAATVNLMTARGH